MVSRALICGIAIVILGFDCLATAQSAHRPALHIQPVWWPASGFGGCGPFPPSHPCDVFSADGDVDIAVALTNISDHPITYRNIRWAPATVFEIRDEQGNLVSETEELQDLKQKYLKNGEWIGRPKRTQLWAGPMPDDETVLKPGGLVSWGNCVSRYYDMSRPGTYSITAKLRSDEPTQEWFYSNQIQVTVTQGIKSMNHAVPRSPCKPL